MRSVGFKFIDLPTAAERLRITRNQLLQWVAEGRIRPFSGSGQQSVFRAADVDRLALEMGIGEGQGRAVEPELAKAMSSLSEAKDQEPAAAPVEGPASAQQATESVRPRRRDPIKLVGTRLSMDSRWAEIT